MVKQKHTQNNAKIISIRYNLCLLPSSSLVLFLVYRLVVQRSLYIVHENDIRVRTDIAYATGETTIFDVIYIQSRRHTIIAH